MIKMTYIDLTHSITNDIKEYPGDPKTKISYFKKGGDKDTCTLFNFKTGLHTGTHIDAPLHYIVNGKSIDKIDISNFCGQASIHHANISNNEEITINNITPPNNFEKIVIIITGWSNNFGSWEYFNENHYISKDLADLLIEKNIKGIVLDACSPDKHGENIIHKMFLNNNIWIVENIANSTKLTKKKYESFFIPLKIQAEASPIRAFVKK